MNSKVKAGALVLGVVLSVLLSGCSSESSKVSKACALVEKGSEGIKANDPLYTADYQEAADILKGLAVKDPKYRGAFCPSRCLPREQPVGPAGRAAFRRALREPQRGERQVPGARNLCRRCMVQRYCRD